MHLLALYCLYYDMLEGMKNGQKRASQIKSILYIHGFSYVWINQKTFDLKKMIEIRIIDDLMQRWYSSSSLTMYKLNRATSHI